MVYWYITAGLIIVGIVGAGLAIYQSRTTYSHQYNKRNGKGRRSKPNDSVEELISYTEIKERESQNANLRQRKSKIASETEADTHKSEKENQHTCDVGELQSNFDSVSSVASVDSSSVSKTEADTHKSEKENQHTCDVNDLQSNFDDVSSVASIDSSSVCSLDVAEIQVVNDCNKKTWYEMSDREKNLLRCMCCNINNVTTIMKPCNHPYMCSECAETFYINYQLCPLCGQKGMFENID